MSVCSWNGLAKCQLYKCHTISSVWALTKCLGHINHAIASSGLVTKCQEHVYVTLSFQHLKQKCQKLYKCNNLSALYKCYTSNEMSRSCNFLPSLQLRHDSMSRSFSCEGSALQLGNYTILNFRQIALSKQ